MVLSRVLVVVVIVVVIIVASANGDTGIGMARVLVQLRRPDAVGHQRRVLWTVLRHSAALVRHHPPTASLPDRHRHGVRHPQHSRHGDWRRPRQEPGALDDLRVWRRLLVDRHVGLRASAVQHAGVVLSQQVWLVVGLAGDAMALVTGS